MESLLLLYVGGGLAVLLRDVLRIVKQWDQFVRILEMQPSRKGRVAGVAGACVSLVIAFFLWPWWLISGDEFFGRIGQEYLDRLSAPVIRYDPLTDE